MSYIITFFFGALAGYCICGFLTFNDSSPDLRQKIEKIKNK